jgi:23S rRNA (guanosine2251-2'-O)-methyltransferase
MTEEFLYGFHPVGQRVQQAPEQCLELICTKARNPRLLKVIDQARNLNIGIRFESREQLSELCGSDKHQGCVLKSTVVKAAMTFQHCLEAVSADSLLLVLDGVQDPHNLGACLRSADACGVDAVIIPSDRAAKMNATVSKVAAGAAESVPLIEVTNIASSLRDLKQAGVWVYGTSGEADDSLYQHDFSGPVALVMGSEGSGLRRLTKESCDHLLKLPMLGRVESLNVSVATGVCLYEIRRSRSSSESK